MATSKEQSQPGLATIVGIGASAGGLEAFEQFFKEMPPDSGLAFVLVSHLDPSRASTLTEILQRSTTMPVVEARDQLKVAANHVYVIPPNRDMAILQGCLQLFLPDKPRGHRLPIDTFLRSLAEDQGARAVGIILSGTGTDGTLGLRAIEGAGGVTLVQEPATAKYDGMPISAIQAGYVTHVLPVEQMPARLANRHRLEPRAPGPSVPTNGLNRIFTLLRATTGHDFSCYKKNTMARRIERRMVQHDIKEIENYARYLKENPAETTALFKELLINVTSFFRDAEAFDVLRKDVLPQLLDAKPENHPFRVWVAGCATGEEAYSLAILLREYMDENPRQFRVQIYGTDLNEDAIAVARAGRYPPNIVADITPERLRRFFSKEDESFRIKKEIREMVVFASQNVTRDPPFTHLDLLSCRNLLIYLEPELQERLIPAFHYALKPGGVLFLSSSESIGKHADLFTPLDRKWKLYRAVHSASSTKAVLTGGLSWTMNTEGGESAASTPGSKGTNYAELTQRALLQSFAPAAVLTDLKGNILYVHGETGKYLQPAPGQPSLQLVEMARGGLQRELRTALAEVTDRHTPHSSRQVEVKTNGDWQGIKLSIRQLPTPEGGQGVLLISFQELPQAAAGREPPQGKRRSPKKRESRRVQELERELAYTRENLQTTIEEQQASNEELKSANEELQSTNEELQSTNEELETSKEEMYSINEELVTVNTELQAKIEQLTDMQNDMKNFLDNIKAGIIFLDEHLIIRRFTSEATRVWRLVPTDVGRPLADIKSDLEGDELQTDTQNVLDSLTPRECEVRTTGGVWFLARIQPYRTMDNVIEGVVLTLTDITQCKRTEKEAQAARALTEGIVDTVREPLLVLDENLQVVSASRSFYRVFQSSAAETTGRQLYELANGRWDTPALRRLLTDTLAGDQPFDDYAVELDLPGHGRQQMLLNARRIVSGTDDRLLLLLAIETPQVKDRFSNEKS